ncbi:MAG: beta strand repeat-containing protein, partial [Candidatus Hodarchaeales archaeon]
VKSYIEGDRGVGIIADSISLTADDGSTIKVEAAGASLAGSFGGVGVAASIGVSLARNRISNEVEAFIANADAVTSRGDILLTAREAATIDALSVAVSLGVGAGGSFGAGLSGAGAESTNIILTKTNVYIANCTIGSALSVGAVNVTLDAQDTSAINAIVAGASAAIGAAGGVAVGGSIGASVARNLIGWDLDSSNEATVRDAAQVQAYVQDSTICASGDLIQTAVADQSIESIVLAFSVGIAGGAGGAGTFTGAGSSAVNKLGTDVKAYIDGSGATGIAAESISLTAEDASKITADVGAASLGVAGSGTISASISIGVSLAQNHMSNVVEAYIEDADVMTRTGDITVKANVPEDSVYFPYDYNDSGNLQLRTGDKVHHNGGVYRFLGEEYSYTTESTTATSTVDVEAGEIVKLADGYTGGGEAGAFYKAKNNLSGVDLSAEDYTDTTRWEAITRNLAAEDYSDGAFWKKDTSISALSIAASLSAAGASGFSGAISGAGAESTNVILTETNAYVAESVLHSAGDVRLDAQNTASIDATVVGVSAAVAGSGGPSVALSIGASVARNLIGWEGLATFNVGQGSVTIENVDTVRLADGYNYIGGDVGSTYKYIGAGPLELDLRIQDYSDSTKWEKVVDNFAYTSVDGSVEIKYEDKIRLIDGYAGGGRGGSVYEYIGPDDINIDLNHADYSDKGLWTKIDDNFMYTTSSEIVNIAEGDTVALPYDFKGDGVGGRIYRYIGEPVTEMDLSTQDFSDATAWEIEKAVPVEVQAYVFNSSITAEDDLIQTALADQSINAFVFAGSVAVGASGSVGLAGSGAGVSAENKITAHVKSFINGDGADGITADLIYFKAEDKSTIKVDAAGASLAVGAGVEAGGALSIGVSLARNYISNEVEAFIEDADNITSRGDIVLISSSQESGELFELTGVGALDLDDVAIKDADDETTTIDEEELDATGDSVILQNLKNSFDSNGISLSGDTDDITVTTIDAGADWSVFDGKNTYMIKKTDNGLSVFNTKIDALSVAASLAVGAGGMVGVAVSGAGAESTNVILTKTNAFIKSSEIGSKNDWGAVNVKLDAKDSSSISATVVGVSAAVSGGWVGVSGSIGAAVTRNLIGWDLDGSRQPAQVQAYVQDSSLNISGDLTLSALADETIESVVVAASLAAAFGAAGVAGSGAGVSTENLISNQVNSYIDGDGPFGISANHLSLSARDISAITADAASASVAFSLGLIGSGSISIAATVADNEISNEIEAYIKNASDTNARMGTADEAGITLEAIEEAIISARSVAASVAVAIPGVSISASLSGAGAESTNTISSIVAASIQQSGSVDSAGTIDISAKNIATLSAEVVAVSASGGVIAGAIGASVSSNIIDDTVAASIEQSTVSAATGDISITAESFPTITTTAVAVAVAVGIGGAGSGVDLDTLIAGTVVAFVDDATLTADNGIISVTATSNHTNTADSGAGSLGVISVAAVLTDAIIEGSTKAYASGNTTISANSFSVKADSTNNAHALSGAGNLGGITGTGLRSTAKVTRTTEAFIGAGTLTCQNGTINVLAQSNSTATATGKSGSVGGIDVTAMLAT